MADIIKTSTKAGNEQQTSTDNRDQTVSSKVTDTSEIKASDTQRDQEPINIEDYPVNDKGDHIVPDDIMEQRYRELPQGTRNESGSIMAYNGGMLKLFGYDKTSDREIQSKGAQAINAQHAHRRNLAAIMDDLLKKPANKVLALLTEDEQHTKLSTLMAGTDATVYDLVAARMAIEAIANGDTKAATFVRDSARDKPVEQQEISANVMTDADRALLAKVSKRVDSTDD